MMTLSDALQTGNGVLKGVDYDSKDKSDWRPTDEVSLGLSSRPLPVGLALASSLLAVTARTH
jgi:hypothetical protein